MELFLTIGNFRELYGTLWNFFLTLWNFLELYGTLWPFMKFMELYDPLWKVVKLYGPFWNFMHFNLRLLSLLSALSADSGIRLEVVSFCPLPTPPIMVT